MVSEPSSGGKPLVQVSAGIIYDTDGAVLACRRGKGKNPETDFKWEFPGGKLEPGEPARDAVRRELREELGIAVTAGRMRAVIDYEYPTFIIRLHAVECRILEGSPHLSVHTGLRWVHPVDLPSLPFCPADIPLLPLLIQ